MYVRNECRTCILADGSDIILDDKIVTLPVKLNKLTFNADLYVLPVKHIDMIIDHDLLNKLEAKIDYNTKNVCSQEKQTGKD